MLTNTNSFETATFRIMFLCYWQARILTTFAHAQTNRRASHLSALGALVTMAASDLLTQGAMASVSMVLMQFSWNIPFHHCCHKGDYFSASVSLFTKEDEFNWFWFWDMDRWGHGFKMIFYFWICLDSLRPSDVYMLQQIITSLPQIMACHLYSDNPLAEPMTVYFQSDTKGHVSMKFYLKFKRFHLWKRIWKCRLQKWGPSCLGLNVLTPRPAYFIINWEWQV